MSMRTNQEYLLSDQYKSASNLSARSDLHTHYSTNKYSWQRWVFDHLSLPENACVLELGCGPAWLWAENLDRIPNEWDVVISDFSEGMIEGAKFNLRDSERYFLFMEIDAQAIPFEAEAFDAVVANHMLYHVPDRQKAYSEIHRILKPEGRLYAATNGIEHMQELRELVVGFDANSFQDFTPDDFNLENGTEELSQWFSNISVSRRMNDLVIAEPEPIVAYVHSTKRLNDNQIPAFHTYLEGQMRSSGSVLRITTSSGVFEASGKL